MDAHTLLATESLSHLTLSPDANRLAFWTSRPSLESNTDQSRLMVYDILQDSLDCWTVRGGRPSSLFWEDATTLGYADQSQIWAISGPGAVYSQAKVPGTISECAPLGRGEYLAIVGPGVQPQDPIVLKGLPLKQDGRGFLGKSSQVVRIRSGNVIDRIISGHCWHLRSRPGNKRGFAYLTRPVDGLKGLLDADLCVWSQPDGEASRVGVPRLVADMVWSPDGTKLAVLARDGTIGTPDPLSLWIWDSSRAEVERFPLEDRVWIGQGNTFVWMDNNTLLMGEEEKGAVQVVAIALSAGTSHLLHRDHRGTMRDVVGDGRTGTLYALHQRVDQFDELVRLDVKPVRLTWFNPHPAPTPEVYAILGWHGEPVETWRLPAQGGRSRGTIFSIHGGPHGSFGWHPNALHTALSEAGFDVIYANPHGSIGYGRAFAASLKEHWGEVDEADWTAILEYFEQRGLLDRNRLGVLGTSYGGFMATWLSGRWPFLAAAVIQAPVVDQVGMYWTSDIGYTFTAEGVGIDFQDPHTALLKLWDNSPLRWAQEVKAPVLLLHGERDQRCPIGQSEALFSALIQAGKTVELVVFPGETHLLTTLGRPSTRVDRTERIVTWLVTHMEPKA